MSRIKEAAKRKTKKASPSKVRRAEVRKVEFAEAWENLVKMMIDQTPEKRFNELFPKLTKTALKEMKGWVRAGDEFTCGKVKIVKGSDGLHPIIAQATAP